MNNNSPTEAGPTNPSGMTPSSKTGPGMNRQETDSATADAHIDAINQTFALFKLNYHNQFFKAYANGQDLNTTKRLWLEALVRFSPDIKLRAARAVIEKSEFLPTLRTMIRHCEETAHHDLPDARAAYTEACQASSPKAQHPWSHLAVYYAGKASDWYFLQTNSEHIAFPVFKQEYEKVCRQVLAGTKLEKPHVISLPSESVTPLDSETNLAHLNSLKKQLDL